MSHCYFAVVPDGAEDPVAVFAELEAALDWAVARYGSDRFRIRGTACVAATTARRPS